MIYGYQLYELMFLFAFYSFAGRMVEQILYYLSRNGARRGVLKGIASPMYGIGAVIIIVFVTPKITDFYQAMVILSLVCALLDFLCVHFVRLLSGTVLWKYSTTFSVLAALISFIVLDLSLQTGVMKVIEAIPALPAMILLLVIFNPYVLFQLDGLARLIALPRTLKMVKSQHDMGNTDLHVYVRMLSKYGTWLRGYPAFFDYLAGKLQSVLGRGAAIAVIRGVLAKPEKAGRLYGRRGNRRGKKNK